MNIFKRHRFPPDAISCAVWLYHRFNLSHRDIEDLLAERGVTVSRESIRLWCIKFGTQFARRLRRNHAGFKDTLSIDEVSVRIGGKLQYLWRAVDQDGDGRRCFSSRPVGRAGCVARCRLDPDIVLVVSLGDRIFDEGCSVPPGVQAAAAPNQTRDLRNRRLSEDSVAVLQTFHRHVACGIVYLR